MFHFRWKVVGHLGSGGFGDVYKVFREGETKEYAMKTEFNVGQRAARRLKVEALLLQDLMQLPHRSHFVEYVDRGTTRPFKWLVMTYIGPSLESVRRMLKQNYSSSTVFKIGLQTVEAVKDLHTAGYIHRDLKPANMCVGLPPSDDSVIYLLDFGIARRYIGKDGLPRASRRRVRFFGTARFCSRACHNNQDQGRKDDLECWFYTLLDLFDSQIGLPWKSCKLDDILSRKNELFNNPTQQLQTVVPSQLAQIVKYIDGLKFASDVDYTYVVNTLKMAAGERKISLENKFDWEGKLEELIREKKEEDDAKEKDKSKEEDNKGSVISSSEEVQDRRTGGKKERSTDRTDRKTDRTSGEKRRRPREDPSPNEPSDLTNQTKGNKDGKAKGGARSKPSRVAKEKEEPVRKKTPEREKERDKDKEKEKDKEKKE